MRRFLAFSRLQGTLETFPWVHDFFSSKLQDRTVVMYWLDDWSTQGILHEAFPCLFTFARNFGATVGDFLESTWNPVLDNVFSDQRIAEFMSIWQSFLWQSPLQGTHNGWEWIGSTFSVRGAYEKIRGGQYEDQAIIGACRFIWR